MATDNTTANKGRRVTDKEGGLLDAAHQAVRLERIEGKHELLTSQMRQSIDNLNNTLVSLQSESRTMVKELQTLSNLRTAHDSNKEAIEHVKKSLEELFGRLENGFKVIDERQDLRWRDYTQNRDQWRREHEAENEDTKRDFEKDLRHVRETTIRFAAFGAAVVLLGGTIVGGFIWTLNYRFADVALDVNRVEASSVRNRQTLDDVGQNHGKELADIKLYLARGGRIPEEPYVPQSQRKANDQSEPRE